jgi:hypothetical protein
MQRLRVAGVIYLLKKCADQVSPLMFGSSQPRKPERRTSVQLFRQAHMERSYGSFGHEFTPCDLIRDDGSYRTS